MADIYCVASAKGGVGKTMTTFALAAAAARGGSRTLILDLDGLRAISWQMGLPAPAAGLCEVLDGATTLPEVMHEVSPNLFVANGSETIDQRRLRVSDVTSLCEAAEGMDVVVIDTAPQLIALTAPMSAADHIVIPTPPDTVAVPAAARTAELALEEGVGDRVAGAVLTLVKRPLTLMGKVVVSALEEAEVLLPVSVYWTGRWPTAVSMRGLDGFPDLARMSEELLTCVSRNRAGEAALQRFVDDWKELGG